MAQHPLDLQNWEYDEFGGPKSAKFFGEGAEAVEIPIEKLLVFTYDKEGGDMSGISVLRAAYKHWYYKDNLYKVDAIQKERHGIGVPIIKLPPNFTTKDKELANELGRNLRTNEKSHVVIPPFWEIMFAKLEGQPVDCLDSIKHHDEMINHNILAAFLTTVGTGQQDQQQLFLKGARFVSEIFRDVLNKWATPELVNFNWPNVEEYPELKVRRIGDTSDWRAISLAVRNLIGSGVLVPDEPLEAWFREEMDLPKADEATKREIPQKGNPAVANAQNNSAANAGKSKQSAAGNMQTNPGSNGRVGRDGAN